MNETGILSKDAVDLIKQYFKEKLPICKLVEDYVESPYWKIRYSYDEIEVELEGDIGFNTSVIIDKKKYHLWQFNREVVDMTKTNSRNLIFVLGVVDDFLKGM